MRIAIHMSSVVSLCLFGVVVDTKTVFGSEVCFESRIRARTAHESFAEFVVADAGRAVCYASEALLIYVYPVCLAVNAVPSVE